MKDYLIRGIDESGNIRVFVASTTNLVEEARQIHNTSPTATAALGRTLTAGLLMGTMLKNEQDVLTLSIDGDGPAGMIHVGAKNDGAIKGYIANPHADVPSREDGKLDVGTLVGREGTLTTIMDLGLKDPYVGKTNLVTGEIAEDLANYYVVSEQQPSAVALGVLVDKDISVKAAGGFIIQLLPGVVEEDIVKIEEALNNVSPISEMIDKGITPEEIMEAILPEFGMKVLERKDLEFKCDCSREKVEKALVSVGKKEIEAIIEEDGQAEVHCHFCNTDYKFSEKELCELLLTIE